ncbi:MAG: DNA replication protein DnaD [Ruminococcaceae bacterium]|nr:DNA replication protein DnaD [Oscillospiraceae bacterium]
MSGYQLHLTQEENVVLGAGAVRRLIESGSGDAALLYLCLARRGASEPEKLRAELRWSEAKFAAAERTLCSLGLVSAPAAAPSARPDPRSEARPDTPRGAEAAPPPAPETAIPDYTRDDVMDRLESDKSFSSLLVEVERKLGKLSDPSLKKLLGLYDYLGLPAEVIYLLVSYCAERKAEQFGAEKPPTMREIEKVGYEWARRELFSITAADAYIQSERKRRVQFPAYMEALRLGGRAPVPSEERYLGAWVEMGFPPETVAVAYDKTILNCGEFKWPYCNGILKRWHEAGLHMPDEVRAENSARANPPKKGGSRNAWMKDYD